MLSPLKLSVIVCGAAAGLAVAPYIVKQILPPAEPAAIEKSTSVAIADVAAPKIDLPVVAPAAQTPKPTPAIMPVSTAAPTAKNLPAAKANELQLAAPALPSPAPAAPTASPRPQNTELTLPSLAAPEVASAMPKPSITPAPTPSPTPEIPYRSEVETAQKLMRDLGLNTGKIDGKLGPNTRAAVKKFQENHDLTASGDVDAALITAMEKAVAAAATPTPEPKIEITNADAGENNKTDKTTIASADDPNTLLVRKDVTDDKSDSAKTEELSKPKVDPGPVPTLKNMEDVRKIQEQLKLAGTYDGDVDGKWGDLTRAAMREFQEKAGIEVTGKPNKETWLAMHSNNLSSDGANENKKSDDVKIASANSTKKRETPKVDPGPVPTLKNMEDVRKIQEQLKQAGTYDGDVDGKWGDLTRAAMRDFQEKAGIEVTGKPNKETWLAMHADANVSAAKSNKADALEISSATSKPTIDEEEPVVVSVNGDGISDPDKVKPLATPRAVSSLDSKKNSESTDASPSGDEPKVKVATPRESDEKEKQSSSATKDAPSDLAIASDNREEQMEKLRAEIENRRVKIESVSNDSTYEVKKYAPKMLETVNDMVDDIKIESASNNPAAARKQLEKIDEELERAKKESMEKKATATVGNVRDSYDTLKKNFPTRIKCLSLKNDEEKSQREELTELVAKVDLGFEAMEKDFKKGNYEPIFKNGKAFCNTIDEINRTMAEVYVTAKLDEKDVKSKLDDDILDEVNSMTKSQDYVKAADKLQAALD